MQYLWFDAADSAPTDGGTRAPGPTPAGEAIGDDPVQPQVPPDARLALVIGNGRYHRHPLANPVRDVEEIAWGLEGLGFKVSLLKNAHIAQMQEAIIAFADDVDSAGPSAIAFVYYAGHGLQADGVNFLIPIGADISSARDLAARAIPLDTIARELGRCAHKATVIVLDACRNTYVGDIADGGSATEGLAAAKLPRPAELIYSTAAMASARDGWGGHSPFAVALTEEMPELLKPGTRIQDVFDTVAAKVALWTSNTQTVAVYREGLLPPFTLTAEDEARLRDWSKRPYRLSRRQILLRSLAGAAAALMAGAVALWFSLYPETRTGLLLRANLLDPTQYDFTCAPPWDGPTDKYGLTRRDWCLELDDAQNIDKVRNAGKWPAVEVGFRAGDPKALALKAIEADLQASKAQGEERQRLMAQARSLGMRAGATDLPRGQLLAWVLGDRLADLDVNLTEMVRDLEAAGAKGVLAAKIGARIIARQFASVRPNATSAPSDDGVEAALREADLSDPSGKTAYGAAAAYRGGGGLLTGEQDLPRYRAWLRKAAFAGLPAAADELLARSASDPELRLSDAERAQLMSIAARDDGAPGLYWKARLLMQKESGGDLSAIPSDALDLLSQAANRGFPPAVADVAAYDLSERGGRGPDPEAAASLLRRLSAQGDARATLTLARLLAFGKGAPGEARRIVPDPAEALKLLENPGLANDPVAMDLRAQILRYGPEAVRNPASAAALWQVVEQRLPFPQIAQRANFELNSAWNEARLATGAAPALVLLNGDADAPVSVTSLLAADCADCRVFLNTTLRPLLRAFPERAKVRFEIRPVWREGDEAGFQAALVAACAQDPEVRFRIFGILLNAMDEWRSLTATPDRLGAFLRLIEPIKGRPDDLQACIGNPSLRAALLRQRDAAVREFGLSLPQIYVAGTSGNPRSPAQIDDLITEQLRSFDALAAK
ncbi:caspase family protein [Xanthobacter aminoxidans]|uniref:caspase family protein n=1 Tax=Xanthobacter aminoxidans TaxID=186280 RepID=UPI002022D925|nr:caspase family protein [Xanthobacter aminoxidans]MCL8385803.1 caspase family protein [Xanthobacter aminoxidans]